MRAHGETLVIATLALRLSLSLGIKFFWWCEPRIVPRIVSAYSSLETCIGSLSFRGNRTCSQTAVDLYRRRAGRRPARWLHLRAARRLSRQSVLSIRLINPFGGGAYEGGEFGVEARGVFVERE